MTVSGTTGPSVKNALKIAHVQFMDLALKWPKRKKVVLKYQKVSEALGAVSFAGHNGKMESVLERWIAGYKLNRIVVWHD